MDRYQEMPELQRTWTPPPELLGSTPREVELSRAGIALAAMAGLLILGGIAAGIALERVGTRESNEQKLLSEQGNDVEASVTRLWHASDKESSPMVAYQFEADGRTYRRSVKAPLAIWKKLAPDSSLAVRFLPSDPSHSHPRDWAESIMPIWVPFVMGSMLTAGGVALVLVLRWQLALLSEGRPAPGVVTRYSHAQHGQKNIHYEFPLLGGELAKGRSGPTRRLPPIGATVCVIYDRENPRRNARYPLRMAQVAREAGR